MRILLPFKFLFISVLISAQTFTEATDLPFAGVAFGAVDFADINGDLFPDLLITGVNGATNIAGLYLNDGQGGYTAILATPFEGVSFSALAFADVDGDADQDVLITGETNSNIEISKLYSNDGNGNFTEMMGTPFDAVNNGALAFADVNGDDHLDVLITGSSASNQKIAKLYTNDGSGQFTEMMNTPFDGVLASSIAFADVNGDAHLDVLITGDNAANNNTAKLYTNDGLGNFTEMLNTPFEGVATGALAFSDVDGDGDQDVLITGRKDSFDAITALYINDGAGNFTLVQDDLLEDVYSSSVAFADVNGDNHQDLFITGRNDSNPFISKLYLNDGLGKFTENTNTEFDDVSIGSTAIVDVNGDNYQDIFIAGLNANGSHVSKLYIHDGNTSSLNDAISSPNLEFSIFPNPTTANKVDIYYDSRKAGRLTLSLYDSKGTLVKEQKEFAIMGKQTFSIDIAFLNQGMYFFQLDDGKIYTTNKFVIK